MITFYETLGVQPDATSKEIESVYRELVKEYHPDTTDEPGAREMFTRVMTARNTLRDEEKRSRYDALGHDAYIEACLSSEKWPEIPKSFYLSTKETDTVSTETVESTAQDTDSRPSEGSEGGGDPRPDSTVGQSTIGDYRSTTEGGSSATNENGASTDSTATSSSSADTADATNNTGSTTKNSTDTASTGSSTNTSTGTASTTTTSAATETTRSEWIEDNDEKETAANGGAHPNPESVENETSSPSSDDTDDFWETEDATVGGDEMGSDEPSEENQLGRAVAAHHHGGQGDPRNKNVARQQNRNRSPPALSGKSAAATYALLNVGGVICGWSFYSSNARQPTIAGAMDSPIVMAVIGAVFVLSATHYVLRKI